MAAPFSRQPPIPDATDHSPVIDSCGINWDAAGPQLLAWLRRQAPLTAQALAAGAAGDDAVAVAALADWLEETGFGAEAEQVRRLTCLANDFFVLTHPQRLSYGVRCRLRKDAEQRLRSRFGGQPLVLVLDEGMTLRRFPLKP